jgi:hypothetical protein
MRALEILLPWVGAARIGPSMACGSVTRGGVGRPGGGVYALGCPAIARPLTPH